jgi:uncharacterized protein (TIGR02001 family)
MLLALGVAALAEPAQAQVAASLSLESDYLLRGVSLSDGQPTLSAAVSYDHPSGAYAGASLTAVRTRHSGVEGLGYVADVGYAWRARGGAGFEVGVQDSEITTHQGEQDSFHYAEAYAELTSDNISLHLYYSPDFIGDEGQTLYLEASVATRPRNGWRLFGHLGALQSLGGDSSGDEDDMVLDANAGIARAFRNAELRLSWSGTSSDPYFPEVSRQDRRAVQAGLSFFF